MVAGRRPPKPENERTPETSALGGACVSDRLSLLGESHDNVQSRVKDRDVGSSAFSSAAPNEKAAGIASSFRKNRLFNVTCIFAVARSSIF